MLARVATAVVCVIAQHAFADYSLIGSWHADDGRAYYEVHFRSDHTFSLFARMSVRNPEIAVAQMGEKSGTWQITGDRVVLDSTDIALRRKFHASLLFRLRGGSLRLQRFYETARTDTYHRLQMPGCAELRSVTHDTFDEHALVGRWRGHYRTHDTEFSFESDRRATLFSWDLGDRRKFLDATWRLQKPTIIIKDTQDAGVDEIKWTIIRTGDRCLVVSDGSEMSYTLQRVE